MAPSCVRLLNNTLSLFHPHYVYRSSLEGKDSCFGFSRLCHLSAADVSRLVFNGLIYRLKRQYEQLADECRRQHDIIWRDNSVTCGLEIHAIRSIRYSQCARALLFCNPARRVYLQTDVKISRCPESLDHWQLRVRKYQRRREDRVAQHRAKYEPKDADDSNDTPPEIPECPMSPELLPTRLPHVSRDDIIRPEFLQLPDWLYCCAFKVQTSYRRWECLGRRSCKSLPAELLELLDGPTSEEVDWEFRGRVPGRLETITPPHGWSAVVCPDKESLICDSGKLHALDGLLHQLKREGHRVLIYSQMTRMIDLLEEYMWHRKHTYMRLDGSSKIHERRDLVADFQNRDDIFVFLLSTRAGGLGINLTAADTVIFYDSDWNPTVDQQAMDRAHRLGQTKQVTIYRLICNGTIEERILQRAREKSEIQNMVITGGNFRPEVLKAREVVSLLIDDEEMESRIRQKQEEKKSEKEQKEKERQRKREIDVQNRIKEGRPVPKRGRPSKAMLAAREKNVTISHSGSSADVTGDDSATTGNTTGATSGILSQTTSYCDVTTSGASSPAADMRSSPCPPGSRDSPQDDDALVIVDEAASPGTASSTPPGRGRGRPRGRPKGSVGRRPRGRGGGLVPGALSMAEKAGAHAGVQAALTALGYSVTDVSGGQSPSPMSRSNSLSRIDSNTAQTNGLNTSSSSSSLSTLNHKSTNR